MTVNEVIEWAGAIITAFVIEFWDEVKTRKVLRDRMKR